MKIVQSIDSNYSEKLEKGIFPRMSERQGIKDLTDEITNEIIKCLILMI